MLTTFRFIEQTKHEISNQYEYYALHSTILYIDSFEIVVNFGFGQSPRRMKEKNERTLLVCVEIQKVYAKFICHSIS